MIISQMVGKFYTMNPKIEGRLRDGINLEEGMRVLIANPNLREDLSSDMDDITSRRALVVNRWATVGELEISHQNDYNAYTGEKEEGWTSVSFVATYDGGIQEYREYDVRCGWLVKIDSISEYSEVLWELRYLFTSPHQVVTKNEMAEFWRSLSTEEKAYYYSQSVKRLPWPSV